MSPTRWGRLGWTLALGALAFFAGGLAQLLVFHRGMAAATAWVLVGFCFLASAPLVIFFASRAGGPRRPVVAWLAVTVAAAMLIAILRMHMQRRLTSPLFALDPDFVGLLDELVPETIVVPVVYCLAVSAGCWLVRTLRAHRHTPAALVGPEIPKNEPPPGALVPPRGAKRRNGMAVPALAREAQRLLMLRDELRRAEAATVGQTKQAESEAEVIRVPAEEMRSWFEPEATP